MLTRKHFIKLAEIIADIKHRGVRVQVARAMVSFCKQQNSRFDQERFLRACKIDPKVF